jgi:hypothetical protein
MPSAADFFKSNWINAKSLEPGVRYEATVVGAAPHTFEDGNTELTIRLDYLGKGIVLNKARNEAMIAAFGINYDNWVGKKIAFWQGDTFFQGRPEKCVALEGIVNDRIETKPAARSAIGPSTAPGSQFGAPRLAQQRQPIDDEPPARDPGDPGFDPARRGPDIEDDIVF